MVKFKRARSIRMGEFEHLGKREKKSVLKTTKAMFRPKGKGKTRHK